MSNEEYIESGLLELYAAGGLSPAERKDVEAHSAKSPEIRSALEEACSAMDYYAQLYAVTPKNDVKSRILSTIREQSVIVQTQVSEQDPVVRPLYPAGTETNSPYKWMFAASVSLFLVTGFLSYFFYNRWQQAEKQLAQVSASEQLMARNVETVSLKTSQLEETLAVLRDPDYKTTVLDGVDNHPESNMVVYWSPKQQQVYVDRIQLPPPPAGMQYQLWALDNGKPVDAGMLPLQNKNGYLLQMKSISSAQAFAVTLEPVGGSKIPTLEQLMVMGNIKV